MISMAKRNSKTDEKWIAQVGIESEFTGSLCVTFVVFVVVVNNSNRQVRENREKRKDE